MKERMEAFLRDLDEALADKAGEEGLDLYHIGRSALVWGYNYASTTQDFDIVRPPGGEALLRLALELFGKETTKAREHGLYLEVVEDAFPPMPAGFEHRATRENGPWKVIRLYRLDPHDLAASKLRRFSAKDRADLRLLCDLGYLNPERLEQILEKAFLWNMDKDGDEFRDGAFRNL